MNEFIKKTPASQLTKIPKIGFKPEISSNMPFSAPMTKPVAFEAPMSKSPLTTNFSAPYSKETKFTAPTSNQSKNQPVSQTPVSQTPVSQTPVSQTTQPTNTNVNVEDLYSTTKINLPDKPVNNITQELYNYTNQEKMTLDSVINPDQKYDQDTAAYLYNGKKEGDVFDEQIKTLGADTYSTTAANSKQRQMEINKQRRDKYETLRNTQGMTQEGIQNELNEFDRSKVNELADLAIVESAANSKFQDVVKIAEIRANHVKEDNQIEWQNKYNQYIQNKNRLSPEQQRQVEMSLLKEKGIVEQKNLNEDIIVKQKNELIKQINGGVDIYQGLSPQEQIAKISWQPVQPEPR